MTTIADNLHAVTERIVQACARSGRAAGSVQLLAVSKTFGPEAVQQAFDAGQRAFGENYIQEAVDKITALSALPIEWHCIGPIQSNKTRLVAEHFQWVHTVDRLKIAQRLNDQRPHHLPPLQVCIQVNVDGGPTKSGVTPQEAPALALEVAKLPRLQLRGIMCIPEPAPDFVAARAVFIRARSVFDAILASGVQLDTLSMGMSGDLDAAIAGGSTLVRVGSAIFGARPPPATA
nr:YggS family pyridoxal phosphate-dependent enzyme [uncultured Rhodoferax sp.]